MYRSSVFYIFCIFVFFIALLPVSSFAMENKVVLFPFSIEGGGEFQYLKKEIPDLIGAEIKKAGGETYYLDEKTSEFSKEDLFKKAKDENSKGFIAGKFKSFGSNEFALEVSLGNLEENQTYEFSEEFSGIENLFGIVNKIAKQIGGILFEKIKITEIEIRGNERIEDEAIKRLINTKEGTAYADGDLSDDLDRIYSMGYFGDIRVTENKQNQG